MSRDDNCPKLSGRIVSGQGEAGYFAGLDWVVRQCREKLGFIPWPGTLNLKVAPAAGKFVAAARTTAVELVPPGPEFCSARVLPARIGAWPAAVVMPEEKVRAHNRETIEILAPVNLRRALGKEDGDRIEVILQLNPEPKKEDREKK